MQNGICLFTKLTCTCVLLYTTKQSKTCVMHSAVTSVLGWIQTLDGDLATVVVRAARTTCPRSRKGSEARTLRTG